MGKIRQNVPNFLFHYFFPFRAGGFWGAKTAVSGVFWPQAVGGNNDDFQCQGESPIPLQG
jgi:hypothetical protein